MAAVYEMGMRAGCCGPHRDAGQLEWIRGWQEFSVTAGS